MRVVGSGASKDVDVDRHVERRVEVRTHMIYSQLGIAKEVVGRRLEVVRLVILAVY